MYSRDIGHPITENPNPVSSSSIVISGINLSWSAVSCLIYYLLLVRPISP